MAPTIIYGLGWAVLIGGSIAYLTEQSYKRLRKPSRTPSQARKMDQAPVAKHATSAQINTAKAKPTLDNVQKELIEALVSLRMSRKEATLRAIAVGAGLTLNVAFKKALDRDLKY